MAEWVNKARTIESDSTTICPATVRPVLRSQSPTRISRRTSNAPDYEPHGMACARGASVAHIDMMQLEHTLEEIDGEEGGGAGGGVPRRALELRVSVPADVPSDGLGVEVGRLEKSTYSA